MRVAMLGAGGFGTALLRPLAAAGHSIALWDRSRDLLAEIAQRRVSPRYPYLQSFPIPSCVVAEPNLAAAVSKADLILAAVPAGALAELYALLAAALADDRPGDPVLAGVSKGILEGGRLPHDLAAAALPGLRYVHLAGPGYAADLIAGSEAGMVAAGHDASAVALVRAALHGGPTWIYPWHDTAGVEAAGAIRTVLSFVFGGVAGFPGGPSRTTRAFVFCRAAAEIQRFGLAMGGCTETFTLDSPASPAVAGDLYLCDDPGSRNWRLGHELARGVPMPEALSHLPGVAECVPNAQRIHALTERLAGERPDFELPWCEAAYHVLHAGAPVADVVAAIRQRGRR